MKVEKMRVTLKNLFLSKYVRMLLAVAIPLVLVGGVFVAYESYRLSKVDCNAITRDAYSAFQAKNYSQVLDELSAAQRACSKAADKLKTNKDKITSVQYEAMFAEAALKNGDKAVAKEHIGKAIESLRAIDVSKPESQLKNDSSRIDISAESLFMLDYEINKKADGSYDGYRTN